MGSKSAEDFVLFVLSKMFAVDVVEHDDQLFFEFIKGFQKFDYLVYSSPRLGFFSIKNVFSLFHQILVAKLLNRLQYLHENVIHEYASVEAFDRHYDTVYES